MKKKHSEQQTQIPGMLLGNIFQSIVLFCVLPLKTMNALMTCAFGCNICVTVILWNKEHYLFIFYLYHELMIGIISKLYVSLFLASEGGLTVTVL